MSRLRATVSSFSRTREEGAAAGVQLAESDSLETMRIAENEVVVEVKAASVSYIDLLMLSGQYHHKPPLPYTPGLEYAGVVRRSGSAVKSVRAGDRVLNDFMLSGPRSGGDYQRCGGWAAYAVAPADALLHLPASLDFDAACNVLLNYETALFAFAHRARLVPGESVLVTGATGAAGLAAVQVAKLLGAGTVIATGRGSERLGAARRLGADHVIDLLELSQPRETGLRDAVRRLAGRGVDVLFDTVGGEWLIPALRALDFGGRLVIIGWAANTAVAGGGGAGGSISPDRLPTNLIQLKGLTVMGSPMAVSSRKDPQRRKQRLARIVEWMEQGLLTPVVSRSFPLSHLHEAMQARLSGGVLGGCVVRP